MGILLDISIWRRARPIDREAVITAPDGRQTHVSSLDGEEYPPRADRWVRVAS